MHKVVVHLLWHWQQKKKNKEDASNIWTQQEHKLNMNKAHIIYKMHVKYTFYMHNMYILSYIYFTCVYNAYVTYKKRIKNAYLVYIYCAYIIRRM